MWLWDKKLRQERQHRRDHTLPSVPHNECTLDFILEMGPHQWRNRTQPGFTKPLWSVGWGWGREAGA